MPINVTITAETPEELARWAGFLVGIETEALAAQSDGRAQGNLLYHTTTTGRWAGIETEALAAQSDGRAQPKADPAGGPLKGKAAEVETGLILEAFGAVETLSGLADVKADALDTIDRLPKYRQEEVQAAFDKRRAEIEADPDGASAEAPETPVEAPAPASAMSAADFLNSPAPAPAPAASAPAPAPAPAANDAAEISDDEIREALEACMSKTSFVGAQERMKAMGYLRLSDVPQGRAAREAFLAKMAERSAV